MGEEAMPHYVARYMGFLLPVIMAVANNKPTVAAQEKRTFHSLLSTTVCICFGTVVRCAVVAFVVVVVIVSEHRSSRQ